MLPDWQAIVIGLNQFLPDLLPGSEAGFPDWLTVGAGETAAVFDTGLLF
jgi:hypothetical protein